MELGSNYERRSQDKPVAFSAEKTRLMVERLSKLESQHQSTRISREELTNRLREIRSQLKKVSKLPQQELTLARLQRSQQRSLDVVVTHSNDVLDLFPI